MSSRAADAGAPAQDTQATTPSTSKCDRLILVLPASPKTYGRMACLAHSSASRLPRRPQRDSRPASTSLRVPCPLTLST
eukprot:1758763-Pyramimonas_sp.AAC.1